LWLHHNLRTKKITLCVLSKPKKPPPPKWQLLVVFWCCACGWLAREFDFLDASKSVEIFRIQGLWLTNTKPVSTDLLSSGRVLFLSAWLWRVRHCCLVVVVVSHWSVNSWRMRLVFWICDSMIIILNLLTFSGFMVFGWPLPRRCQLFYPRVMLCFFCAWLLLFWHYCSRGGASAVVWSV
jgi:hypothetical protein